MTVRKIFVLLIGALASLLLASCRSAESRAAEAYSDYQAASAVNDDTAAKRALLQLVAAKDDDPQTWAQLGRLQTKLASYGDAYYAFTRANELDHGNPEYLRALAQIALSSRDFGLAAKYADQLDVAAPGDPWVTVVRGYTAITDRQFDSAAKIADELLAQAPYNSVATVLKARALVGLDRFPEAVKLLEQQIQNQPNDVDSLKQLSTMYQLQGDWANMARVSGRLFALNSSNTAAGLLAAEAEFRNGNAAAGRELSLQLLEHQDLQLTKSVLQLWLPLGVTPAMASDALRLGVASADGGQRLALSEFLCRAGYVRPCLKVVGPTQLPVSAKNAEANAITGEALVRSGQAALGMRRFDAVLDFDADNATALRARAELLMRTDPPQAVIDSQRLVAALPDSPEARLLLVRSYKAAGLEDEAQRTLWAAFHDLPAEQSLFNALVASSAAHDISVNSLREEFRAQRTALLTNGAVS
jgi:predicted Zn-dependent protease